MEGTDTHLVLVMRHLLGELRHCQCGILLAFQLVKGAKPGMRKYWQGEGAILQVSGYPTYGANRRWFISGYSQF